MLVLVSGTRTTDNEAIFEPKIHKQSQKISLSEHYDRFIRHSIRIHMLSNNTFYDFIEDYTQGWESVLKAATRCHTSSIATPRNKEQEQCLSVSELFNIVIVLVDSWHHPLRYLVAQFINSLVVPGHFLGQCAEMVEQMSLLAKGMPKIAKEVGFDDGDTQQRPRWTADSPRDECSRTQQFYSLLSCFRRDSHKIVSFLKLLKCRLPNTVSC